MIFSFCGTAVEAAVFSAAKFKDAPFKGAVFGTADEASLEVVASKEAAFKFTISGEPVSP